MCGPQAPAETGSDAGHRNTQMLGMVRKDCSNAKKFENSWGEDLKTHVKDIMWARLHSAEKTFVVKITQSA